MSIDYQISTQEWSQNRTLSLVSAVIHAPIWAKRETRH